MLFQLGSVKASGGEKINNQSIIVVPTVEERKKITGMISIEDSVNARPCNCSACGSCRCTPCSQAN